MRQKALFICCLIFFLPIVLVAQEELDSAAVDTAHTPHYIGLEMSPISRVLFNTTDIRISAIYRKQINEKRRLRIGITQFGAVGGALNNSFEINDSSAILTEPNFYRVYGTFGNEWIFPTGNFNFLLSADVNVGYGNQEVLISHFNKDSLRFGNSQPAGLPRSSNPQNGEFSEYSMSHSLLLGAVFSASIEMKLTNRFSMVMALPVEFTFLSNLSEDNYTETYNSVTKNFEREAKSNFQQGTSLTELTMLPARVYLFYHF